MSKRAWALFEVCAMNSIVVLIIWLFEAYLKWLVFWDWYFKALLALIALLAVIIPGRSLGSYGFLPRNPRFTLKWSVLIIMAFTLPTLVSIAVSMAMGVAKYTRASPLGIVLYVVWNMVFIGLVEEVYYRGYVQSRLNEVFEKHWGRFVFKSWRVDYGAGLLIASLIFAVVHIVNYWNPLIHRWEPSWWIPIHITGCFLFGCLAGALREASGDVYVPASLHGGVMTAYAFLLIYTDEIVLNVAMFIAWFIFFYSLAYFFEEAENTKVIKTRADLWG